MKTPQSLFIKGKLTEGSIGSHLIKLTIPMLLVRFTFIAFNVVDTYFVAQLGTDKLAAMSFTFPAVMIIGSIAMGIGNGAGLVIARVIGEGDHHKVQRTITDSLMLSVVMASILIFITLATIDPLFAAIGAKPEIISLIREYIEIIYLGSIFLFVSATANNAIRASGNAMLLGLLGISSTAINLVLDPFLIFGWGFFPRLELRGAALATIIAQGITLIFALIILYRQGAISLKLPRLRKVFQSWKNILHLAIPSVASNAIKPIYLGLITSMVAVYGQKAIAGFGIASRVELLVMIVFSALAASMGPIVGQNWGAGKLARINRALLFSSKICLIWGIFMSLILALVSPNLASLFDHNSEVLSIVATYFAIVPISYAAFGIIQICSSTFNAIGMVVPPVAITIVQAFLLYLPLAVIGSKLFGIKGIFLAICLSNLLIGIGCFVWNRRTLGLAARDRSTPTSKIAVQRK